MSTATNTAVIYARISKADADVAGIRDTAGVDRQVGKLRVLAERRQLAVVEEIIENDTRASRAGTRSGFRRVLQLIESGSIKTVLAFAIDRLGRNRRDLAELLDAASRQGVDFVLLNGADVATSTPAGRLVASMLGAVAVGEVETMGLRLSEAYEQRAKKGTHVARQRVFGFMPGNIEHNPEEAEVVREMFARVAAGESISATCRAINERGIVSTKGNPFSRQSLMKIITNPRYVGRCEYHKIRKDAKGRQVAREKQFETEGTWEPIVEREVFDRVAAIVGDPRRRHERVTVKHLLTGVTHCGECGLGTSCTTMMTGRRLYRCPSGKHFGRTADIIDDAIVDLVIERLATASAAVVQGGQPHDPEVEIVTLEERRKQLGVMFADGILDAEAYAAAAAPMAEKINAAKARAANVDYSEDPLSGVPMGQGKDAVRAMWDAADIITRRRIVARLFDITFTRTGKGKPAHPLVGLTITPLV